MEPAVVAVDGADPQAVAAIKAATDVLRNQRSYKFEIHLSGGRFLLFNRDEYSDLAIQGVLIRDPKLSVDARMTSSHPAQFGENGSQTESRLLIIDDDLWDPLAKPPRSTGYGSQVFQRIAIPDGVVAREVTPFAGAFARIGEERRNGLSAIHFRATQAGQRAFASAMVLDGAWSADLWIAKSGGYLLAAAIHGNPPAGSPEWIRAFDLRLDIRDANDRAIKVDPSK